MKKLMTKLAMLAAVLGIAGCTPTLAQKQAVAKQLGTATAVTWIATDNPSAADIAATKQVVEQIREACCTNCSTDASYYARVYPIVDQYITEKVKPENQAKARLGAAFMLTGLDTAFAMNPEWKSKADDTTAIIDAYCDGLQVGLAMSSTDPVMQAATRQLPLRIRLKAVQ